MKRPQDFWSRGFFIGTIRSRSLFFDIAREFEISDLDVDIKAADRLPTDIDACNIKVVKRFRAFKRAFIQTAFEQCFDMRPDIDFDVYPFVRYDRLPCFVQERMRTVFIRVSACDTVYHPVRTGSIYCPVNTRFSSVIEERHAEPYEIIARLALNVIIRQELGRVHTFHKNEFDYPHTDFYVNGETYDDLSFLEKLEVMPDEQ